jgi:hypothetical protein
VRPLTARTFVFIGELEHLTGAEAKRRAGAQEGGPCLGDRSRSFG